MKHEPTDIIAVNLLKQAVESKGCLLDDVDIGNMVIKVTGPDDVVADRARAVVEILD